MKSRNVGLALIGKGEGREPETNNTNKIDIEKKERNYSIC